MTKNEWSKNHLLDQNVKPPFSFIYGDQPSDKLLADWPRKVETKPLDAARTQHTIRWNDPNTGLEVRCVAVDYNDYPVVEWTVYFKNASKENTPILKDVLGLDCRFDKSDGDEFILHHNRGDVGSRESYTPLVTTLQKNTSQRFAPNGGRPTNGAFPYFNLQTRGGGIFVAIGWPGQWSAHFSRDAGNELRIVSGQELTHLTLKAGEEIRTPLTVLLFWKGSDVAESQNLWRRWMVAHNLPRTNGNPMVPQLNACSSHQFGECFNATEENQKQFIDLYLAKGIKLDYWWCDVGWFNIEGDPAGGQLFPIFDALYNPHPKRFPNGLKAVSDHAHQSGVKLIAWFEPEHYYPGPGNWVCDHHPEWLLKMPPGHEKEINQGAPLRNRVILDIGNPEARRWISDRHATVLREQGIDLYRLDFNIDPLLFWRNNDTPDRQGITENHYVTGFLANFDELRQRRPGLIIDNCASGGRRNDLETVRRTVPLLRSDYLFEPIGQQGHTYGLSAWLPFYGSGSHPNAFDAYSFRSVMCPSMTLCYDVRSDNREGFAKVASLVTQWRNVAAAMLGDYYPLTSHSIADNTWIAWQFNRPEQGDGVIQAFRRDKCEDSAKTFRLSGLDPAAQYELTNFDIEVTTKVIGKELMGKGVVVAIKDKPGAAVITYKRTK